MIPNLYGKFQSHENFPIKESYRLYWSVRQVESIVPRGFRILAPWRLVGLLTKMIHQRVYSGPFLTYKLYDYVYSKTRVPKPFTLIQYLPTSPLSDFDPNLPKCLKIAVKGISFNGIYHCEKFLWCPIEGQDVDFIENFNIVVWPWNNLCRVDTRQFGQKCQLQPLTVEVSENQCRKNPRVKILSMLRDFQFFFTKRHYSQNQIIGAKRWRSANGFGTHVFRMKNN